MAMEHKTAVGAPKPPTEISPGRRTAILVTVLAAAFMDFLDNGIVVLAVPAIQADLGGGPGAVQLTIAGYTLAFAVGLVTGGRIGDVFGRRRVFLIGTVGFVITSVMCGMAPTIEVLMIARIAQGLTAALTVPQVLAIIKATYPPGKLKGPLAAFGAMAGVANVSGPLVAGLLIESDFGGLGWRVIFLVNIPVGILVLLATALLVPETRSQNPPRLDLAGVAFLTAALLLVVYPLVEGPRIHWPWWLIVMPLAAIPVLWWFWRVERRHEQTGGWPLLPTVMFTDRSLAAGLVLHVLLFSGIASFFMVSAITLQSGLGFSVLGAGLTSLPWPVALIIFSGIGLALVARMGRRLLSLGALMMVAGMGVLMWSVSAQGAELSALHLAPGLALAGTGMAFIAPSLMDLVLSAASTRDAGAVSGALNTALQVGTALGIAVLGLIFFVRLDANATDQATALRSEVQAAVVAEGLPPSTADEITTAYGACFEARFSADASTKPSPDCAHADSLMDQASVDTETVSDMVDHHSAVAHTRSFADSLWYGIAVFGVSFALIGFLPRRMGERDVAPPK